MNDQVQAPAAERKPVQSMTGFATIESALPDGRSLALTIKSVNHRHLDLTLRLAGCAETLEPMLRRAIKAAVARGHVEMIVTVGKSAAVALEIDHALVTAYVQAFRELADTLNLPQQPDLNAILRQPGVLSSSAGQVSPAALEQAVAPMLHLLLQRFTRSRLEEGAALAAVLAGGADRMERLADEARQLRSGVAAAEFERLKLRLGALLEGSDASEDRLLTEAALLAARGDVEEELVRLRTHIARFRQILSAGGEVGRQLDFLLQEMNREANTALSKTGASAGEASLRLTAIGLEMKLELERAREQVQNLA